MDFKKMLQIAADSDLPVLITGESGTGKEIAARELHSLGKRKNAHFVAVNCGAISAGIAESLFCGHIRGAFTGANREQQGFVRAANGGTLFLDEVAELPPEIQKSLLRTLQERTVTPVGSQREIRVDFRLVCATHRDLPFLVEKGLFRQDLYFRLAVLPIKIPPLRERSDLRSIACSLWKESEPLTEQNFSTLQNYYWPGNIRQLKNVLERYALFKKHGYELESLLKTECDQLNEPPPPQYTPNNSEIEENLELCKGNKSRTAKKLGISRGKLYYYLRKGTSNQSQEDINTQFNCDLEQQIGGTLSRTHIYKLGKPGKILLSIGMPDLPIELKMDVLAIKASQDYGHPFNLLEIKDLPLAINEPIAVFAYGDKAKAVNVITEIKKDEKNFLVGISLNPEVKGKSLNINSIRTIFPKDISEWKSWIDQGKSLYLNKEKMMGLLNNPRNPEDVSSNPNTINIVNNFVNVK